MSRSRSRGSAPNFSRARFICRRTFKAVLGITPREYADSCRMRGFRQKLKAGHSVTRAMHDAGYSSTSRLYSRTSAELGMEPAKYRRGAIAAPIRYSFTDSPIGRMLIAATDKGICSIQFADSEEELEQGLKQEFPFAIRRRDDQGMDKLAQQVVQRIGNSEPLPSLPLDIQATRISAPGVVLSAIHRLRKNQIVLRSCESHPAPVGGSRGCASVRHQPGGDRNPVPPCASLQMATWEDIAGDCSARRRFSKWNRLTPIIRRLNQRQAWFSVRLSFSGV